MKRFVFYENIFENFNLIVAFLMFLSFLAPSNGWFFYIRPLIIVAGIMDLFYFNPKRMGKSYKKNAIDVIKLVTFLVVLLFSVGVLLRSLR